ncbi:MAG: Two-component system sensor histidine kinase [uncultured Acidimicrobiales bacterium]|uniref:Signal transduction histidine-protein kinase/phosphatase MprB n=1 Tax=uncultured Acidimicrobiales bacterium TaxID=310071 RepID=A0A6J4I527_9ACTN|nr:MAG: Two-component system sensor histidine kinase [uncultured Acidimicrobiales bacterium]
MRPLDGLRSIKLKLGAAIVASVVVSSLVSIAGVGLGVPLLWWPVVSAVIALGLVQVLAHGMTSPLREMADAARAMAKGEHGRRVRATAQDEVGDLARAFNAMAAELESVDRLRRDLVANVSHELRTPISALQAVLENVVDGVEAPEPDVFRTMLRQTERLGRLVTQLLDLSRLESGSVPLQRSTFHLGSVIDDAVEECRLHGPTVVIRASCPDDLCADADPERLHQVLANLLENAVRHSPPDGTVEVRAWRDAHAVSLEVLDEGPGIPEGDAERVFDRFYRADAARASDRGGAGLGLAIARWIVDLHGGDIRPERRQPRGCRMVVVIPDGGPS